MANSRRGTGDYVEKGVALAHIRREDLQNQVAQAAALNSNQAVAQHTRFSDQDFSSEPGTLCDAKPHQPSYDQSQEACSIPSRCAAMDNRKAAFRQPSAPWRPPD